MAADGVFLRPITKRGQLFKDDFFQDFHKNYDTAVHDVMNRWSGRSLLADQFSSNRKQRENKPVEDSIAASISDTEDSYVIVLDMSDFVQGDITVETIGRSSVVKAKAGSNSFNRRYPLPMNTNLEAVNAAMSDEGILTITAPKQGRKQSTTGGNVATANEDNPTKEKKPSYVSAVTIDVGESSEVPQTTSQTDSTGRRIVPLVVEGDSSSTSTTTISGSGDSQSTQPVSGGSSERKVSSTTSVSSDSTTQQTRTLPIAKRGRFFQDAFFENVWKDFETAVDEMVDRENKQKTEKQNDIQKVEDARQEARSFIQQQIQQRQIERQKQRQQQQQQQQQQLQESLQHLQIGVPKFDRMNSYRNLRGWAFQDDTQAATFSQDSTSYKIVVDVHDFVAGKLDVQAMDGAVVITGEHGSLSFRRRFSLPGLTKPGEVTSDISTDGVLTVTAPK